MLDIAVVGSGIGGSLFSALNSKRDLILFEKDANLGGCASTFERRKNYYNAGATTFVGYEDGHIIKNMFDEIDILPNILKSDIAIRVIQKDKTIDRVANFEQFLEQIEKAYPNKKNRQFWQTIKDIDERFWKLNGIFFAKYSTSNYIKTATFLSKLFFEFKFFLLKSGESFIKDTLGDISEDYLQFLNSQLLITIQTTSQNIPLLSMALGLAYPFHDVFYANKGMGELIQTITSKVNVHKKEEIISIHKEKNFYYLISNKSSYMAKNVVLNSTIYDSNKLFIDEDIRNYYKKYKFSDQSAFVVYLKLSSKTEFLHHYQIILDETIPNCISNSFFISFSDKDDELLSKNGYSITISTHTKALFWKELEPHEYKIKKLETENFIIQKFLEYFSDIKKEEIIDSFSATSATFEKFINRLNCGGRAMRTSEIFNLSPANTQFNRLYSVGDTIFSSQGFVGVAIGVKCLNSFFTNT